MWKNLKPQASTQKAVDYGDYVLSGREKCLYLAEGLLLVGIFAYFFYRSIGAFLLLAPSLFLFLKQKKKELAEKRRKELRMQFKDAILYVSANQKAGYSVENALAVSREELTMLYGREGMIVQEFSFMVHQIKLNRSIEQALEDFSRRSGLEDVKNFAEVFSVAKRSSGDVGGIMRHTAEIIRDKMQVKAEILTMTASRQFEQRIMNMIPFFIVFYVESASPGFFVQMYGTSMGRVLMRGCLIVYLISYILSKRILEIEV